MKRLLAAVLAAFSLATPSIADLITLGADPWCPCNCEPDTDRPGFMVELAQEALALYGHEVRYVTVSWARGLRQAEIGEINGVIGAVPEEAEGFIYGPAMGIYQDTIAFRRGEALSLEELSEATGLRIGAINGYEYYGAVNDYVEENEGNREIVQYTSGDDALFQNLRKLIAGRLDMVAEVRAVLNFAILELGIGDELEIIASDDSNDIFIALTRA